jgi:TonB family protein
MDELFSSDAVVEIQSAAMLKRLPMLRESVFLIVLALVFSSSVDAQSPSSIGQPAPPRAVYTPKPVYRPEWAKQGLKGKGIVLVTIDKQTGKVAGARMQTSTGNPQLDGAALQAYSQWRFDPETVAVPQLKIPIEFANHPLPQPAKHALPQPVIILIVLVIAGVAVAALRRRNA